MTIKHLVVGGGGPGGFLNYGALKESNLQGLWHYKNIKSIYSTSAGAVMSLPILLNLKWQWIDDYLIKRPWHNVVKVTTNDYFKLMKDKGLLNKDEFMDKLIGPLLKSADLEINTTLKELYDKYPIEFYLHTVNINEDYDKQLTCISYKTHPDMLIKDAIYMSASVPLILKPIFSNDGCFVDGGLLANIPLDSCIKNSNCKENEILVVKYNRKTERSNVSDRTGIWSYLIELFSIFTNDLVLTSEKYNLEKYSNILVFEPSCKERPNITSLKYWLEVLNSDEERELLVNSGINYIKESILSKKFEINKLEYTIDEIKEDYKLYYVNKNRIKKSYSF